MRYCIARLILVNYNRSNSKWNGQLSRYKRELSAKLMRNRRKYVSKLVGLHSCVKSHYCVDALLGMKRFKKREKKK